MKGQPNRLEADTQPALAGSLIDRSKPLQFRLDGRLVQGFAGDSVLSAALASGIDSIGEADGQPIGLTTRFAPPIRLGRDKANPALPMARTPAMDGAEWHSLGARLRRRDWAGLLPGLGTTRRSLRHDLDHAGPAAPWADQLPLSSVASDVVVVGGGVAGMNAALAAAQGGAKVTLIESAPLLGGCARYFGSQEGDESPEQSIARLTAAIAATDAITVMLRAAVQAVRPGRVRVHRVLADGHSVAAETLDITAPNIILATGAIERLPVFPGNRLPRVSGTLEAALLAERYGVWLGQSAILATVHSAAYRLPMLLSDAGITTQKIADTRPHPQSRFIEYAKAYGITQAGGTIPARAEPAAKGLGLSVTLQLAFDGHVHTEEPSPADLLLVCGGWQPDLTLWHMAGAQSRWSAERHRIEPLGALDHVALAGSAAGWVSKHACLRSAQDAVNALFGRPREVVTELAIDPIYETPDDPTPTVPRTQSMPQASYLDAGRNLIQPPDHRPDTRPRWWPFRAAEPTWSLADQLRTLGIADVAAGVQLGGIPAESAGVVAQERTLASGELIDAARLAPPPGPTIPAATLPAYLTGRFGPEPQLWRVAPQEPRTLQLGALIFLNSDQTDPRQAIGAIVGVEAGTAIALIGKLSPQAGDSATLRDHGRAVPIHLVEPVEGSDPPFSSAAGAA